MGTIFITSSCGEIYCDPITGDVTECNNTENDPYFDRIKKFDLEEYKKYHNRNQLPEAIDILDLGYWLDDGTYETPVEDWRENYRHLSIYQ